MKSDDEFKLGQYYKIKMNTKLGKGAFGEVLYGINIKTNEEVAVKRETTKTTHPQLAYETKVLKFLQGGIGIPNVFYYCVDVNYNYMVMDLLGSSLEDLFIQKNKQLSLKTIVMLSEQMLSRIEYIHSKGIIHRDIKPDNYVIGIGKKKHLVYIVDFGLAKKYKDYKTGEHISYKDGRPLTGTARYASIFTHLGIEQSRRDDLESLGYVMIYLLRGELPWQGIKAKNKKDKYQKIMDNKIYTSLDQLCLNKPNEFINFFQYCRSLQFDEKPDYAYLKSLLKNVFDRYNYDYDYVYDWDYITKTKSIDDFDDETLPEIAEENKLEIKIVSIEKLGIVNRLHKTN